MLKVYRSPGLSFRPRGRAPSKQWQTVFKFLEFDRQWMSEYLTDSEDRAHFLVNMDFEQLRNSCTLLFYSDFTVCKRYYLMCLSCLNLQYLQDCFYVMESNTCIRIRQLVYCSYHKTMSQRKPVVLINFNYHAASEMKTIKQSTF